MKINWWNALGKPVPQENILYALDFLTDLGYDPAATQMVLAVVCREIEHDNPKLALRYLRSHLGRQNETLVLTCCAKLCVGPRPAQKLSEEAIK
jgi:hypothetical protein